MKPFLDTHILLWWLSHDPRLPKSYLAVLEKADAENPFLLSEISLWEIATLHSLGATLLTRDRAIRKAKIVPVLE